MSAGGIINALQQQQPQYSGRLGYNVDGKLVPLDQVQNSIAFNGQAFDPAMQTPPSGYRPSGDKQFYQPIYQQEYQNNNVDTPYGASQYGKGVQYLQNPFSYAPPGVSYGSQGGMGGMANPFTYRGGNISANSGMGYGGYGAYGTQTPGAGTPPPQTGGINQYIYGPNGMFPTPTGTPTGAVTTPPRETTLGGGMSNSELLAAIEKYVTGSPMATRASVPTPNPVTPTPVTPAPVTPTLKSPAPATSAPATSAPSTGGFVAGPYTPGGYQGFPSKDAYDKAVAIQTAKTNAENAARDAYKIPLDSPFYAASIGATGDNLNNLKEQAYEFQQRQENRAKLAAANPGVDGFVASGPDDMDGYYYGASKFGVTSKDWLPNVKTRTGYDDPNQAQIYQEQGASTTSTAAPALSDLDQYALQTYGRPLTDTEKQVLSGMPLSGARSVMDTSIANYNAAQAAASTPSAKATSSDSSANNMARGGIAALLRRR